MIPKKRISPCSVPPTRDESLRARGLRLTAPRRLILDVVRATDVHPSAAVVFRRLRRSLPHVSLATVYRNLRLLAAEGLLLERAEPSGLRFDGKTEPHDHFTCRTCGRIFDVPRRAGVPTRDGGRRRRPARGRVGGLAPRAGFEVMDYRVEFYGRCRGCRRPGASSPINRR
jgi:Fur family ferric uptake transcriptional regulator/Fur family peroxide stress response transcriptional regulator